MRRFLRFPGQSPSSPAPGHSSPCHWAWCASAFALVGAASAAPAAFGGAGSAAPAVAVAVDLDLQGPAGSADPMQRTARAGGVCFFAPGFFAQAKKGGSRRHGTKALDLVVAGTETAGGSRPALRG